MITFTMILVALLSLLIATALIILAGGAGVFIAFGDVLVCGLIIFTIIRLFMRRK